MRTSKALGKDIEPTLEKAVKEFAAEFEKNGGRGYSDYQVGKTVDQALKEAATA